MGEIKKLYDWRILLNGLTTYVSWRTFDVSFQNYLANSKGLNFVKSRISEGTVDWYDESILVPLSNSVDKWLGLSTVSLITMIGGGTLAGYFIYKAIKHKLKSKKLQDVVKRDS